MQDGPDGAVQVFRLVKVETDGEAIRWLSADAVASPAGDATSRAGAVALDARTLVGPADQGVDDPFPLSTVLALARSDLVFRDLAEFLVAHPDAYVSSGAYLAVLESGQRRNVWDFEVSDGIASLEVVAATPGPAVAAVSAQAGFGSHSFVAYEVETTAPPPTRTPATLPSVAALLERSHAPCCRPSRRTKRRSVGPHLPGRSA